jgi:hypothetical protein
MKKESCLSLCIAFAVCVVSCSPISNETSRSKAYSKKATWQEAMLASRVKLPASIAEQKKALEAVELGTWYVVGPIKGGKFTDRSLAEKPVDLLAADSAGKRIWRKNENIRDREVYREEHRSEFVEPVYLYRRIKAKTDLNLTASIGSKNTLEVWLNGREILTSIKEQGLGRGRHLVHLNLKKGANELLVRVFNWRRRWEFYFSPAPNPALKQWRQIKQDFPFESRWMERNLRLNGCLAWFSERQDAELEETMRNSVGRKVASPRAAKPFKLRHSSWGQAVA